MSLLLLLKLYWTDLSTSCWIIFLSSSFHSLLILKTISQTIYSEIFNFSCLGFCEYISDFSVFWFKPKLDRFFDSFFDFYKTESLFLSLAIEFFVWDFEMFREAYLCNSSSGSIFRWSDFCYSLLKLTYWTSI